MAHQGQSIHNPATGQRMTFTTLTDELLELTSVNPVSYTHLTLPTTPYV